MMYLSQLLGKTLYKKGEAFAKVIDMTINEHELEPSVTKIEIKKGKRRIMIAADVAEAKGNHWLLKSTDVNELPKESTDYYLSEDLLDKQVIDLDGRRLVRVNDILLDTNGKITVSGLDVGVGGILRRLGLGIIKVKDIILPWKVIEAFDYDTGSIRLKLKQNSLNTFHPAELADILEDVGTKERLGIVSSLNADQAAQAIEESDEETQISILEGLKPSHLREILNKMHIAELADVFHEINPEKLTEITHILGNEKTQKVKKLMGFSDNTAGGLMHDTFFSVEHTKTVSEIKSIFQKLSHTPESIIITKERQFFGTFSSKDLLNAKDQQTAEELVTNTKSVLPNEEISDIIELFANYNLRGIPVVDESKQPIGIVLIDEILKLIEEENQKDES